MLLKQVFREWHILGDSGDFIPGDRPRAVLPRLQHKLNTEFSNGASFLPFIDNLIVLITSPCTDRITIRKCQSLVII